MLLHRTSSNPRWAWLMAFALTQPAAHAVAQAGPGHPVTVRDLGHTIEIVNGLPAPVAVLLLSLDQRGPVADARVQELQAGQRFEFARRTPAAYAIAEVEVLDPRIGIRRAPACSASEAVEILGGLRASVDSLMVSETSQAFNTIAAAAAVAQVTLRQRLDSLDAFYNDALSLRLQGQMISAKPWQVQGLAQANADLSRQAEHGMAAAFAMALAYGDESFEKKYAAEQEKDLLAPVAAHAPETMAMLEARFNRSRSAAAAYAMFANAVAKSLGGVTPETLSARLEVHRLCPTPAPGEGPDPVVVSGLPAGSDPVIVAQATFDHGGSLPMVLRKLAGDPRWVGRLYWPVDASKVQVRLAGARYPLTAERLSVAGAVDHARSEVQDIKKRFHDAGYRAAGGDDLKTIIVP